MIKRLLLLASILAFVLVLSPSVTWAKTKAVTLTGEAKCAKCMLHEGTACQTVIQVTKGKKTRNYYVADNEVSKNFHQDVCHAALKVKATGMVKKVGNKRELTLTKIEPVK